MPIFDTLSTTLLKRYLRLMIPAALIGIFSYFLTDLLTLTSLNYLGKVNALSFLYHAYYQISVRQATVSLLLLLACTSQCIPCKSLSGSLATTPLGTSTQGSEHAHHTNKRSRPIGLPLNFVIDISIFL